MFERWEVCTKTFGCTVHSVHRDSPTDRYATEGRIDDGSRPVWEEPGAPTKPRDDK